MLKESDSFEILKVTFVSKLTFEKHLPYLVSRVTSQRLGILSKSRRVFNDRLARDRRIRGFVLPIFE